MKAKCVYENETTNVCCFPDSRDFSADSAALSFLSGLDVGHCPLFPLFINADV